MGLTLNRRQHLAALDPDAEEAWFAAVTLTPLERVQLRVIAATWAPSLEPADAERMLVTAPRRTLKPFADLADVAIEWWDVERDGEPILHVWLYAVDAGAVFRGGTADMAGTFVQGWLDDHALAPTEPEALEAARRAAVEAIREARQFPCALKSYRFAD